MTTEQFRTETIRKSVPAQHLCFEAIPMQFVDAGEVTDNEAPISMLARSPQPIEHWFWGKVVHDMSGMQLRKDRLPIDWCHEDDVNLGYLDSFEANENGLTVSGKLIAFTAGDKASEVIHRGRKGVPYEASIDFRGGSLRVEELGAGVTADVNGYTLEGPAVIIREWALRAVAVCPHGADGNTVSQFTESDKPIEIDVQLTKVAGATDDPPPDDEANRTEFNGELQRYIDAFGFESGVAWFQGQKPYVEALELHNQQLATALDDRDAAHAKALSEALTAKDREIAELGNKLSVLSASLGEETPATFGDGEGGANSGGAVQGRLADNLGKNIASFASGIKLPSRK